MSRLSNKCAVFLLPVMLVPLWGRGQQIFYSPFPGVHARSTTFDIIGKYHRNRLIYTKNYSNHQITCYNEKMQPVDTIILDFLPDDLKDLHFISLPDHFIMLYQYVKKRDIYCKAVLFNNKGKKVKEPVVIDKTPHPFQIAGDLTYSYVVSEDKSRILIYKLIKKQEDKLLIFKTFLLDSALYFLQKGQISIPYTNEDEPPQQIQLANNGDLYFLYGTKSYVYQPYFESLSLFYKPAGKNKVFTRSLFFKDHLPAAHLLLTLDEEDQKVWINTFNFDKKNRHLSSLFTYRFDMNSIRMIHKTIQHFSPANRKAFAEKRSRRKSVFDHYVPHQLIFNRSGSALLIAEKEFEDVDNEVHFGDIGLFSLSKEGKILKIQRIIKEQDQYTPAHIGSFLMMNNGRALHFLLNKSHSVSRFLNSRIYLLRDYRYLGNKTLQQMPVMARLDKGYQWLPGLGKQTGLNEVIIPCLAGGNLLFGCISY